MNDELVFTKFGIFLEGLLFGVLILLAIIGIILPLPFYIFGIGLICMVAIIFVFTEPKHKGI